MGSKPISGVRMHGEDFQQGLASVRPYVHKYWLALLNESAEYASFP